MEKQLKELNEIFALLNMKAFCERYGLQYDYLRKVLKGDYPLSANKLAEYETALGKFFREWS